MMDPTSPPGETNRLAAETSPYLKSAAHQPVHWYPWSKEAFEKARVEHKPILLDIGAVWCHWCHVMDEESYDSDTTARIINENYVAVKVDRDERPDVDTRYQSAVGAIVGQGGWPLTVFLTPDGDAFYGGTYFPPEDRYERIGFPKILQILAEAFRSQPDKVREDVEHVRSALQIRKTYNLPISHLSDSHVVNALEAIASEHDPRYGGFGPTPKFPHCGAIELLLSRYVDTKEQWMIDEVRSTLRSMARGGVYDQLGGGFHRYSTDEKWIVPHFEKMLFDNAPLLANYVHAYQATYDEYFKHIALDIVRYVTSTLSDQLRGGFYASQDADIAPADDGSYYTWSIEQAKSILSTEEWEVAQLHYNIYAAGEMHHDSSQNVLFIDKDIEEIAAILRRPEAEIAAIVSRAKKKMLESRVQRRPPFVDQSMYANWNGMMISSYLEAFKALGLQDLRQFALKTLDRVLTEHATSNGTISHKSASTGSEAFLDDQTEIADALLHAFEVTANIRYLEHAGTLMHRTIEVFGDAKNGGFFDISREHPRVGLLSVENKPIQDSPTAGPNAVAISVLNRLYGLTGNVEYRNLAEKSLKFFADQVSEHGIFAARFFLALHDFLHPVPTVVVISPLNDATGQKLFDTALRTYRPGKTVAWYDPSTSNSLPEMLQGKVNAYSKPVAYVCSQFVCGPPNYEVDTLVSALLTVGPNNIPTLHDATPGT